MPSGADATEAFLVDTSVAIALVLVDHEHHGRVADKLVGRRLGLAGHAEFEAYSVLTRMPPPSRRAPAVAARVLACEFPETRHLSVAAAQALISELAERGIAGGTVFDALIAKVVAEADLPLVTRDRRALPTYRALGAQVEFI